MFHPTKPHLFVCTQVKVRIYNLAKQRLHKVIKSKSKWISSIAIHPQGDNIITGSFDKKLEFF